MAEYYALLTRAVGALPRNDEASRREIYVKARSALIKQLKAIDPPLPAAEISKQRLALEDAIRRVEREAVEAAAAAMLSEEEITRRAEQALAEALNTGPEPAAPPQSSPPGHESEAYAHDADDAAAYESSPDREASEPQPQDDDTAFAEVVTPPVRPRAAPRAAPSQAPFERAPNVTDVEAMPPPPPSSRPPPPPRQQSRGPSPSRARSGGRGWERAPRRQRTMGGRITFGVLIVLVLVAIGYFAATEWDQVTDFFDSVLGNDTEESGETPADAGDEAGVGEDDPADVAVVDGDPDADAGDPDADAGDPVDVVFEETPPFIESSAVFYVEPDNPDEPAERYEATIDWSLDQDPDTGPVIAADISIPERGLEIALRIARSPDPSFSHDVVVQATLDDAAEGGPLQEVENLAVKSSEEGIGVALEGTPDARQNFFFIPLPVAEERQNTTRLRISPWFDLSLVYQSGERAIISFSKGTPGDEVFAEALEAWANEG